MFFFRRKPIGCTARTVIQSRIYTILRFVQFHWRIKGEGNPRCSFALQSLCSRQYGHIPLWTRTQSNICLKKTKHLSGNTANYAFSFRGDFATDSLTRKPAGAKVKPPDLQAPFHARQGPLFGFGFASVQSQCVLPMISPTLTALICWDRWLSHPASTRREPTRQIRQLKMKA